MPTGKPSPAGRGLDNWAGRRLHLRPERLVWHYLRFQPRIFTTSNVPVGSATPDRPRGIQQGEQKPGRVRGGDSHGIAAQWRRGVKRMASPDAPRPSAHPMERPPRIGCAAEGGASIRTRAWAGRRLHLRPERLVWRYLRFQPRIFTTSRVPVGSATPDRPRWRL